MLFLQNTYENMRNIKVEGDNSFSFVSTFFSVLGRIMINKAAFNILEYCDGDNSVQDICHLLNTKYDIDEDIISICQKIKKDDDNSITPVIVLSSNKNHTHRINLLKLNKFYCGIFNIILFLFANKFTNIGYRFSSRASVS